MLGNSLFRSEHLSARLGNDFPRFSIQLSPPSDTFIDIQPRINHASNHCLMTPDINDCGVTRHLVTHHIVWNTRQGRLRHRQNLLCSIHTASRVTSCVVWFTRLFKVSLMLYQCHARLISLSQLLPVLDAHFVYIWSLPLPLELAVANTIHNWYLLIIMSQF